LPARNRSRRLRQQTFQPRRTPRPHQSPPPARRFQLRRHLPFRRLRSRLKLVTGGDETLKRTGTVVHPTRETAGSGISTGTASRRATRYRSGRPGAGPWPVPATYMRRCPSRLN
jgi:hypothetical protein